MATQFNQWISDARELNPGASFRELTEFHREKYGQGATEDDFSDWAKDARTANPGVGDDELRAYYVDQHGTIEQTPSDVGLAFEDFKTELASTGRGLQALAADTLGFDEARDSALSRYSELQDELAGRRRPQYDLDYLLDEGGVGDYVDAAQYLGTKGALSLLGGLGAGAVGKFAAKKAVQAGVKNLAQEGVERAAKAGFYGGLGGYSVGQGVGNTFGEAVQQRQVEGGSVEDVDTLRAVLGGTASGLVGFAQDVLTLGLGRLAPGIKFSPLDALSPAARGAAIVGGNVASEAVEEPIQTSIEALGADRPLQEGELAQAAFEGALGGAGTAPITVVGDRASIRRGEAARTQAAQQAQAANESIRRAEEVQRREFQAAAQEFAQRSAAAQALGPFAGGTAQVQAGESIQDFADRLLGIGRRSARTRADVNAAFEAPSGIVVPDPDTQAERELTQGELALYRATGTVPPRGRETARDVQRRQNEAAQAEVAQGLQEETDAITSRLSEVGGRAARVAKDGKAIAQPVRRAFKELQALSSETPDDATDAEAMFETITKRAKNSKYGAAMEELVAARREELQLTQDAPASVPINIPEDATASDVVTQLISLTPNIKPEQETALRLMFGDTPEGIDPQGPEGRLSIQQIADLMAPEGKTGKKATAADRVKAGLTKLQATITENNIELPERLRSQILAADEATTIEDLTQQQAPDTLDFSSASTLSVTSDQGDASQVGLGDSTAEARPAADFLRAAEARQAESGVEVDGATRDGLRAEAEQVDARVSAYEAVYAQQNQDVISANEEAARSRWEMLGRINSRLPTWDSLDADARDDWTDFATGVAELPTNQQVSAYRKAAEQLAREYQNEPTDRETVGVVGDVETDAGSPEGLTQTQEATPEGGPGAVDDAGGGVVAEAKADAVAAANETIRLKRRKLNPALGKAEKERVAAQHEAAAREAFARAANAAGLEAPDTTAAMPRAAAPVSVPPSGDTFDIPQTETGQPAPVPNSIPDNAKAEVGAIRDTIGSAAEKLFFGASFTKNLARHIGKKSAALRPHVDRFMASLNAARVARTRLEKEVSTILDTAQALDDAGTFGKRKQYNEVNAYLREARKRDAWGYIPDWKQDVRVDPYMAAEFAKLTPQAQQVVEGVNRTMHKNFQIKQELINKRITQFFDEQIAASDDTDKIAQLEAERATALKQFGKVLTEVQGPYSPLKRHGKYIVKAWSHEFGAAMRDGDTKKLEELRRDENHYWLEFTETRLEAISRRKELKSKFANTDFWEKALWRENRLVDFPAVDRLRAMIAGKAESAMSGADKKAAQHLTNMAEELALQVMTEHHARQAHRRADNVAGADQDMLRSFVSQGRADAQYISSLQYMPDTNDALSGMARVAESDDERDLSRDETTRMVNAMYWHWGKTLDTTPTPYQDRLAALSSSWHLTFSPAYYAQNALQVQMMSVPEMASRWGWRKAEKETFRAYADIKDMVTGSGVFEHFDTSKVPEDVRHVIKALEERGSIDIFMELELGKFAETGDGAFSRTGQKLNQTMRRLPAKVETINRVVTAIAAYRLAKQKRGDAGAIDYADTVINDTHGDYDGMNKPKFISPAFMPLAKLITQFRTIQFIQGGLYAKLLHTAMKDADPDERAVAVRGLIYNVAHLAAFGGARALPAVGGLYFAAQVVAAVFGDEDEPFDQDISEAQVRRGAEKMGFPPEFTDLLISGVPSLVGLDLADKVGTQNIASILPYTEIDTRKQGGYEKVITGLTGAAIGGMGSKIWRGAGKLSSGDYYGALEDVLPSGMSDAIQGYRLLTEGVKTSGGDQAVSPENMGEFDWLFAGLGFTPETLQKRWAKLRVKSKFENKFSQRTSDIKKDYAAAVKEGDRKQMKQARQEWQKLQTTKRRNGFRPSPMSDLLAAPRDQRKRERQVVGGVGATKGNRQFVRELDKAFGD